MAYRSMSLELLRDGQCTAWGFRLTGGHDVGTPLLIQRVSLGSPAEGELRKGDVILGIGDVNATQLSHQGASKIIAKTGNTLKLVIARSTGPAPLSPAVSPTPGIINTGAPNTFYNLKTSLPAGGPATHMTPPPLSGNPDLFRPLPKTEFPTETRHQNAELQRHCSSAEEKEAIAQQAYRTFPLITPGSKASKDCPVGSYLRFTHDTSGRTSAHNSTAGRRVSDCFMLTMLQESVQDAAHTSPRASVSSSRTSTPDFGQSVHLRQYNSPIHIYSNQAIMDAFSAQAAVTKQHNGPSVPNTPKTPADISKSPTYQLIQEEEQNLTEHRAVENQVHDVTNLEELNTSWIQQSGSFKTLMTTLRGVPAQKVL